MGEERKATNRSSTTSLWRLRQPNVHRDVLQRHSGVFDVRVRRVVPTSKRPAANRGRVAERRTPLEQGFLENFDATLKAGAVLGARVTVEHSESVHVSAGRQERKTH